MTLLQFLAKHSGRGKRPAKALLDSGQVLLDRLPETNGSLEIGKFHHITAAGEVLQANTRRILLLHKPTGFLSATTDPTHQTVIDLIPEPFAHDLHLAGRLDRSTTGLVILTNDSILSRSLTSPHHKIPKTYLVHTDSPIPEQALEKFRTGMSFKKENTRSHPAIAQLLADTSCRLTIFEGLHHQIKRMFLRFGIRVTSLHRESIGPYHLGSLLPAQYQIISSPLEIHPHQIPIQLRHI